MMAFVSNSKVSEWRVTWGSGSPVVLTGNMLRTAIDYAKYDGIIAQLHFFL